jgi:uncharacterized protein with HEPN domain
MSISKKTPSKKNIVDYEILWDVFENKLPDLQRSIQSILNPSL